MNTSDTSSNAGNTGSARKVLIGAYVRTPIGKVGGKLSRLEASDLAAHALRSAVKRAGIKEAGLIDLVVAGHAVQSYFEPNTARIAMQKAGLPDSISAYTIQQQCASGMNAAHAVFAAIKNGEAELGLAVGVESMSLPPLIVSGHARYKGINRWLTTKAPKFLRKFFKTYGPLPFFGLADSGLGPLKQAKDPSVLNMIKTAQIVADLCGITREQADYFANRSQSLALNAIKNGRLAREIEPLVIPGVGVVATDEFPRKTDMTALSGLPEQARSRVVTAGNASGMGDGAGALVLCTEEMAARLGIVPLAELVDVTFSARHAVSMGLGPVGAVNDLLARHNLTVADINYWEINEAFAAQALACIKRLGIDIEKVNHNGGGVSLSHPLGMTGARIIGTGALEPKEKDYELVVATLCVGGGMGAATLIKAYR